MRKFEYDIVGEATYIRKLLLFSINKPRYIEGKEIRTGSTHVS